MDWARGWERSNLSDLPTGLEMRSAEIVVTPRAPAWATLHVQACVWAREPRHCEALPVAAPRSVTGLDLALSYARRTR